MSRLSAAPGSIFVDGGYFVIFLNNPKLYNHLDIGHSLLDIGHLI